MNMTLRGIGFAAAIAVASPLLAASPLLNPHELNTLMAEQKVIVLDVRGGAAGYKPEDYTAGHIPGAIHSPLGNAPWRATVNDVPIQMAPLADIEAHMRSLGINNNSHVVVVTGGKPKNLGDFATATRVYWTMKAAGLENVSILNGGIAAWTDVGYGLVGSPTVAANPGTFTARANPRISADLAAVEAAFASGSHKLVDARPWKQYTGEEQSGVVKAAGTIPGAVNATAVNFMNGNLIEDRAAIRAKLARIGVQPTDKVITFCNGGYFCTAMWFVMHEVAGMRNVQVFDGSMAEWTLDPARPVAPGSWASLNTPVVN